MNFKTTVVLIVLLAVAGLALLFTRDKVGPSARTAENAKIVGIKPDEISRIAVAPSSGQKYVLERAGLNWKMLEPVAAPADTSAAQDLADALARMESRGLVPSSTPGTGIDQPQFKVEITGKSNEVINLSIGEKSAAGGNLYLQKQGGSDVLVVPAEVYDLLDKPVTDFRRKKLIDVATAEVRTLRITTPAQLLSLQKPSVDWQMTAPLQVPAETSAVSDVLTSVSNLQAVEFLEGDRADAQKYGFAAPVLTVEWSNVIPTTQPTPTTQTASSIVKFGRYDDLRKRNIYVSVDGVIAKVAASTLDTLKKSPLDLRDRKVLNIEPVAVSKITLSIGKSATTQPSTRPASSSVVTLSRRKHETRMGPELPSIQPTTQSATQSTTSQPSTGSTTGPTTVATTAPATAPTAPLSKWIVTVDGMEMDAADSRVDSLLDQLHPLRAEKYVESSTAPGLADQYKVTIELPSRNEEFIIRERLDITGASRVIGRYNDLNFEAGSSLLSDLKADFTKAAPAPPSAMPMEP